MKTPRTYSPSPNSVAWRVCAYFVKHPEEELSGADVALKFDCSRDSVTMLLRPSFEAGLLTRQGGVYSAGPALPAWKAHNDSRAAKNQAEAEKLAAQRATKNAPPHLPELDVDSLPPVEVGVPLPDSKQSMRRGRTKYDALFESLGAVGHSRLIPAHYVDAIKKAAAIRKKYHGEAYLLMRVDPQMARIWRVEPKARKGAQAANDAAERSAA